MRVKWRLWLCLFVFVLMVGNGSVVVDGGDLLVKCKVLVDKVIPCLNYVTGQAAIPTKDCCEATSKIKESDPECLCYVIQQTHKGIPEIKNLGIQESRLLQLPTSCNLKNASANNCPKLLGLSPNSPDAAIFKNASLRAAPPSPVGTKTPISVSENHNGSYGNMLRPPLMTVTWAILLVVIPSSNWICQQLIIMMA